MAKEQHKYRHTAVSNSSFLTSERWIFLSSVWIRRPSTSMHSMERHIFEQM